MYYAYDMYYTYHMYNLDYDMLIVFRKFAKGGLVKGGLAIYVFPLCNCNALGSAFNMQIEHMHNC